MYALRQDIRYALRVLTKNPTFSLTIIVTLALAIGVNSAMFSLVNGIVFAPLPYADADRLVNVYRQSKRTGESDVFSYPDYQEYRDRCDSFEGLAAWSYLPMSIGAGDAVEWRFGQSVTGNYFELLGVKPLYGRLFTTEDNVTPGGHPVAVISHNYWERVFGGRPEIVGETIQLGGFPFTIVGVTPPGFSGIPAIHAVDVWTPLVMMAQIRSQEAGVIDNRSNGFLHAFGKLKTSVSASQAETEGSIIAAQLVDVDPERYRDETLVVMPARGLVPLPPGGRDIALSLAVLVMALVGLVLLVGGANVANLLLARATLRRREIGIRMAIGASRWQIVRQLLAESVILAIGGGLAGLLLADWTLKLLIASLPTLPYGVHINWNLGIDQRVLLFTLCAAILTGILCGLFPALGATRRDLTVALKDDRGGILGPKRSFARNALVVGQVTVSMILLASAGLFVRSLISAQTIDPGFDHQNVLSVMLDFGARGYDGQRCQEVQEQILQRVRVLPGVEAASIDVTPPLTLTLSTERFWIEDYQSENPEDQATTVALSRISTDYFHTLGIDLIRGRDFTEQDTAGAPLVAIVNQAFVDRYWQGQNPLGKRISDNVTAGADGPSIEVVGVCRTLKHWFIGEDPRPFIYLPFRQQSGTDFATLLVRATQTPTAYTGAIRGILHDVDPGFTPMQTCRYSDMIGFSLLPARLAAGLFSLFGLLALLLAAVGLYGVLAYAVSQRTREIGIRTTLGARSIDILRLVLKQGLRLTVIGLALGLAISLVGARVFSSLLYDVSANDPLTFIAVSLLLVGVALAACLVPARRATRIDPMVALRTE